ncbi:MAG: alpha/beta fold hydrolase [archaeon]
MQSELIRLRTKDGLELQGLLYESKGKRRRAIVHVHGWVGNCYENAFIGPIARSALQRDIALLAFNNRGAGIVTEFIRNEKRENIGGCLEIFEESPLDIEAAIRFLAGKGYSEITLQGHSLGCQKVICYQNARQDRRVNRIVLLAPVNDVEYVQKKLLTKYNESIGIARDMVKKGRGQDAVPGWMQFYPLLSANMFLQVSDPNSVSGRIFDYDGKLSELKKVRVPVLAVFGSDDDFQANPAERLGLLKKTIKCSTVLMKNSDHWFTSHEDELAQTVVDWIAPTP